VSYTEAPTSVRSLEQRIRNLEGSSGPALRRRVGMAMVVVGQIRVGQVRIFEVRAVQGSSPGLIDIMTCP
jgi:hypothetical protein